MYSDDARQRSISAILPSQSKILPILVLYGTRLQDSATYQSFIRAWRTCLSTAPELVVYDNSPVRQVSEAEEQQLLAYKHDPKNGGLAAAYNWALEKARLSERTWLLLLDQDSTLPDSFVELLLEAASGQDSNDFIAAIVPFVSDHGVAISPKCVRMGRLAAMPTLAQDIADFEITAINSGTTVKVSFLTAIGGFDNAYWLDYLDHWLFHQIYATGNKVAIVDSVVQHNLSVRNYRQCVSSSRYRSILSGESRFIIATKPRLELAIYTCRLLARSVKLLSLGRLDIALLTIRAASQVSSSLIHPVEDIFR